MGISTEIINRGFLLPEEAPGLEPRLDRMQSLENRYYPKPADLLFVNPFAVAKKPAKKGKKKKKWIFLNM